MYAATIVAATAALAASVSALPSASWLSSRQSCSTDPWYVNTQPDTSCDTTGTPQFASGPSPGMNVTCESLQGTWGAVSVSVDGTTECDEPYELIFYTTSDCSDAGTSTTTGGCIGSPVNTTFTAFSAIGQF